MSITLELTRALSKLGLSFQERGIAREIDALLHAEQQPGRIGVNVSEWACQWGVMPEDIWRVIQAMEGVGFWQTYDDIGGQVLHCPLLTGSSKALAKTKKRSAMAAVKQKSAEQRAVDMSLSDVNLTERSLMADVIEHIPLESRFARLSDPYAGWLPADRYAAIGMVFKPDSALLEKLSSQFPSIDMDLALAMMYEDLRECPHHRPSVSAFGYWMPNWIKKNESRLTLDQQKAAQSAQLDSLLDSY